MVMNCPEIDKKHIDKVMSLTNIEKKRFKIAGKTKKIVNGERVMCLI